MVENKKFRKIRTRHLIQVGGLIDKSGLLNELGIPSDMDLQSDGPQAADFSATLYGMFLDFTEQIQNNNDRNVLLAKWRFAGKAKFREEKDNE